MTQYNSYALGRCTLAIGAFAAATALLFFSPKAPAASFTYSNPSCTSFTISGTPPTQTITCVSSGGAGGAPTCAPTANPASPAVNTQTIISANCTNSPTSYLWNGGACAGTIGTTCSVTKSKATTVTYSVTATNAAGTSPAAQISVTWH